MNMAKHTGLPYEARELATDKMFPATTILGKSKRGDPMVVCRVDLRDDAAFIVRACNSYADLLAACLDLRHVLALIRQNNPEALRYIDAAVQSRADAAIDKASNL
jgi:hypothetical protein